MQPATYASVAHVGWERSIRWEAPDDDDAAERAAPVVGGDARVARKRPELDRPCKGD